jgi:hypothetical protein
MRIRLESGDTVINRLNVRRSSVASLAAQLQITRLFNSIDFYPAGLSPFAIICIRRMRDPMPGTVSLDYRRQEPPFAWRRAVGKAIETMAMGAVRPIRGLVPANAECVVFDNPAELLACLAGDWSEGSAGARWWWKSLFPATDLYVALTRLWAESAEYVPAALDLLAIRRKVVAFAHALREENARVIRRAVIERFAFHEIDRCLAEFESLIDHSKFDGVYERFASFWQNWPVVENRDASLGFARQSLLCVGLMAARAPAQLRSRSFAQSLRAQVEAVAEIIASERHGAGGSMKIGDNLQSKNSPSAEAPAGRNYRSAAPDFLEASGSDAAPVAPSNIPSPSEEPEAPTKPLYLTRRDETTERVDRVTTLTIIEGDDLPNARSDAPLLAEVLSASVESAFLTVRRIETEFGGVFYLVNFGLYAGLYEDFTSPRQTGIDLPLWDFLALAGERLVGERLRRDPVWMLLAQLAGRDEAEEPGLGFNAPEDWRLPEEWSVGGDDGAPAGASAAQWTEWLAPHLRSRLRGALGCDDDELARLLIERQARVEVSATHMDVRMSLNELPIEIRLAGLDRNPGWVPAAGRFIAFHFD